MDCRARIRLLVHHKDSKFLVLIDPDKLIKDLKVEVLRIYSSNHRIELDESNDPLELLAYDGFALCDDYTVSDALYDGCLLTTSHIGKNQGSYNYRFNPGGAYKSQHSRNFPLTPHLFSSFAPTSSQLPLPPSQSSQQESSAGHMITPSSLPDIPQSQSDAPLSTACDEDKGKSSESPSKSVDEIILQDPSTTAGKKRQTEDVYEFRSEDSETPIVTPSKKPRKAGKLTAQVGKSVTAPKQPTKQNKQTPKVSKSKPTRKQQPAKTATPKPIRRKTTPSMRSPSLPSDCSTDDEAKSTTSNARKRPPPKKRAQPAKKIKKSAGNTSKNTIEEDVSSWSSVNNETDKEDEKTENGNKKNAEKASDIRTTPTTASPIVNITKVNQDLQNKKLKSQTDKTAPTPKAKRVINLYQSDNSDNEESASDSNDEDSENEHVDIMIESKSDKEDTEQVTANVKMGRVSETKSPAVSTEDAETIKISAGSDEEESELEEEEDGDETMMEAANESRVEKVVKEPVTENRQSKDTEKVALSQELFANDKSFDVSDSCSEDYSSDEVPVIGDRTAQKSTALPVVRKKSEIMTEHAEKIASLKASTIPEKEKGGSSVSGSPTKQQDTLAQKLSKKPKQKSQPLQTHSQNSLSTPPKSKSRSKTNSRNDISLTLRSTRDNAVVSSSLVSSGRAKVTGKFVPKPSPRLQPKAESGHSSRQSVADRLQNNTVQEEDSSSDSDDSSTGEESEQDAFETSQQPMKKKPSKPLQDLAHDADSTVKSVNMKTANLVPHSSNVRKKLLQKTSLAKNLPPAEKARLKSSTPALMRYKSDAPVKKSHKVSKLRAPRLEGISKEEEEMALNLSQQPGSVSKIFSDKSLWSN